jgi:hypothetical protein
MQELMRRTDFSVTLKIWVQAITRSKCDAQSRVESLLLDKKRRKNERRSYLDRNGSTEFWMGFSTG